MLTLKYSAMATMCGFFGLRTPVRHALIVCLDTPRAVPSEVSLPEWREETSLNRLVKSAMFLTSKIILLYNVHKVNHQKEKNYKKWLTLM